jgi:hypothetical protein
LTREYRDTFCWLFLFFFVQQYLRETSIRVPKTGREIDFVAVAFNDVILIFDINQSFHVRLAFRFFVNEIRNHRIYNTYFFSLKDYYNYLQNQLLY